MEFPKPEGTAASRKLSTEEVQDAQIGLLEWELEERNKEHGIDPLTGLKTRKVLMSELENSLKFIRGEVADHHRSEERIKNVSLLFIDLDNFKQVNDTRGHLAGDEALVAVAEVLSSSVRDTDVVARFGGDEFYILLPRVDTRAAEIVGNKILENLKNNQKLLELGIGASIGVSSSDMSTDAEELVDFADLGAKKAKQEGKNQVQVYG